MSLGQQIKAVFFELVAAVRALPDSMTRWALRQHQPFDLAGDGTGPAVCARCKVEWPCAEYVRLDRSLHASRP